MSNDPQLNGEVAAWLRGRRRQIAADAVSKGLPLQVIDQIQVAEYPPTGGMAGNIEERLVSSFSALSGQFGGVPGITRPLIDNAGGRIAGDLVDSYGGRLKYLARTGPRAIERDIENAEILQNVTDPSPEPFDPSAGMLSFKPIFYALMLLRQCLIEYLTKLKSLDGDDIARSERLADELVAFCASADVVHVGRVPLAGIDLADGPISVDSLTLAKLNREELGYLFWRRDPMSRLSRTGQSMPGVMHLEEFLMERVVVEVRESRPKVAWHTPGIQCQKTLLALHLHGLTIAGSGFGAMLEEPLWVQNGFGQSVYPLLMPRTHTDQITVIGDSEVRAVEAMTALIPDSPFTAPSSPQDLTLSRLALAMSRTDPREALVDYTIALEALLLAGTDIGEARRRFALNGAVYVGSSREERLAMYKQLYDVYGARSVLVHGVDPSEPRAKRVLDALVQLRDQATRIASRCAVKALESGWPTDAGFLSALLDDPHAAS
jgi:hypothetical protein